MRNVYLLFLIFPMLGFSQDWRWNLTKYREFVVCGDSIYVLKKGDSVVAFDKKSGRSRVLKGRISAIAKTKEGLPAFAFADGQLRIGKRKLKVNLGPDKIIYRLFIDKKGNPAVFTSKGIFHDGQFFEPEKISLFRNFRNRQLSAGTSVFQDSDDRFYVISDEGEFGGRILIFDLSANQFVQVDRKSEYEK